MVRPVDRSSGSHHPQSVTRGQGAQASEGVQSLAKKIGNIVTGNITPAGRHVFTKKTPDKSLANDVGHVSDRALKNVGQLFKRAGKAVR